METGMSASEAALTACSSSFSASSHRSSGWVVLDNGEVITTGGCFHQGPWDKILNICKSSGNVYRTFAMAFLLNSGISRTRFPIRFWCVAETQKGDVTATVGWLPVNRNIAVEELGRRRGRGRVRIPVQKIISENWKMQNWCWVPSAVTQRQDVGWSFLLQFSKTQNTVDNGRHCCLRTLQPIKLTTMRWRITW